MKPLDTWRKQATYFSVHGWKIASWTHFDTSREKPWLLLIHGFPTSSWDWTRVWPTLEKKFNLAAIDMLGFGLSEKPRNIKYRIVDQADLQEVLLEKLGVGEAHVLAHDYGDTVAQELIARHNEGALSFCLKSVCFLNGGLFPEQHRARPIQKLGLSPVGGLISRFLSRSSLRKGFDEIFGPDTKASDDEIDGHWSLLSEGNGERIFHKLLNYIPERRANRDRWVGALTDAAIPLKLIDGGVDPVSGAHLYHYYREQIPNANASLLEDIGHYPQTEDPANVARLFLEFHQKIGTPA
jgi:pimeloyl-ACP methyl ester carboxylesterase